MRNDDVLWEIWIDGFDTARQLRANSWAEIPGGDEKTRSAWAGLVALVQIGLGESTLPKEQVDDLIAKAPDLIPHYIETLNACRPTQNRSTTLRKGGPQRAMPLRLRKEIQAMLRPQLTREFSLHATSSPRKALHCLVDSEIRIDADPSRIRFSMRISTADATRVGINSDFRIY